MIHSPLVYLFVLALLATLLSRLEQKSRLKIFTYIPSVVMIYALAMVLSMGGLFARDDAITHIYSVAKQNLLPAMLFLMLLQVDLRHFAQLGKKLLIAYLLAVVSIGGSIVVVVKLFDFSPQIAAAFAALSGSWMGGTANMIAVGSALDVDESSFGYAMVVDSVVYSLWVVVLLLSVPFAKKFDTFTQGSHREDGVAMLGCACTVGAKRYYLFIILSLAVAFMLNFMASNGVVVMSYTTTLVLGATLLGLLGSFTPLKNMAGSSEIANTMLYLLVALIGSRAVIEDFSGLGLYVGAGVLIIILHAIVMIAGAKLFGLDLFSISVASLANIGGVASAPILAAAHNKALVSIGVVMAIMGYLIGTFGGLFVGGVLLG